MQPIIGGEVTLAYIPSSGGTSQGSILGQSKIDSMGNFSISYPCQNGGSLFLSVSNYDIYIPSDNGNGDEIPLNQNMNQTWTAARFGWLKIYLNPQNPMGGDTLLVWYTRTINGLAVTQKDTILKNITGILDSLYLPCDGGG